MGSRRFLFASVLFLILAVSLFGSCLWLSTSASIGHAHIAANESSLPDNAAGGASNTDYAEHERESKQLTERRSTTATSAAAAAAAAAAAVQPSTEKSSARTDAAGAHETSEKSPPKTPQVAEEEREPLPKVTQGSRARRCAWQVENLSQTSMSENHKKLHAISVNRTKARIADDEAWGRSTTELRRVLRGITPYIRYLLLGDEHARTVRNFALKLCEKILQPSDIDAAVPGEQPIPWGDHWDVFWRDAVLFLFNVCKLMPDDQELRRGYVSVLDRLYKLENVSPRGGELDDQTFTEVFPAVYASSDAVGNEALERFKRLMAWRIGKTIYQDGGIVNVHGTATYAEVSTLLLNLREMECLGASSSALSIVANTHERLFFHPRVKFVPVGFLRADDSIVAPECGSFVRAPLSWRAGPFVVPSVRYWRMHGENFLFLMRGQQPSLNMCQYNGKFTGHLWAQDRTAYTTRHAVFYRDLLEPNVTPEFRLRVTGVITTQDNAVATGPHQNQAEWASYTTASNDWARSGALVVENTILIAYNRYRTPDLHLEGGVVEVILASPKTGVLIHTTVLPQKDRAYRMYIGTAPTVINSSNCEPVGEYLHARDPQKPMVVQYVQSQTMGHPSRITQVSQEDTGGTELYTINLEDLKFQLEIGQNAEGILLRDSNGKRFFFTTGVYQQHAITINNTRAYLMLKNFPETYASLAAQPDEYGQIVFPDYTSPDGQEDDVPATAAAVDDAGESASTSS